MREAVDHRVRSPWRPKGLSPTTGCLSAARNKRMASASDSPHRTTYDSAATQGSTNAMLLSGQGWETRRSFHSWVLAE